MTINATQSKARTDCVILKEKFQLLLKYCGPYGIHLVSSSFSWYVHIPSLLPGAWRLVYSLSCCPFSALCSSLPDADLDCGSLGITYHSSAAAGISVHIGTFQYFQSKPHDSGPHSDRALSSKVWPPLYITCVSLFSVATSTFSV